MYPTLDQRNVDSLVSVSVFLDPLSQKNCKNQGDKQEGKVPEEKNFPVNLFLLVALAAGLYDHK